MEQKNNKYKNKLGMQHKAFPVKDYSYDGNSRTISGYAAIFGNIDKARDMLIKGCFAKSIQERGPESSANDKIIFLWQHDSHEPVGRITSLKEDDRGLYFEAVVDEIEIGDRILKQLESGTLNQFSIGYCYVWNMCEWDNEKDCLIVKEVKLFEISVVSIGCNGETEYLGLKSKEDYEKAYKQLDVDITDLCSRLGVNKQIKLHEIVSKAMSLASFFKPEGRKPSPLDNDWADGGSNENKKSVFDLIKKKV